MENINEFKYKIEILRKQLNNKIEENTGILIMTGEILEMSIKLDELVLDYMKATLKELY